MVKLLLASDLHIGRASSRLGEHAPPDGGRAASAWERLVETAIDRRVAAVCLAGDVVEQEAAYWEARGILERGIDRLAAAGIVTVAVAGNHDHAVLAQLAAALPPDRFRLLGAGGRWEEMVLAGPGGAPALRLHGWSFPRKRVRMSPLATYDLPPGDGTPVLGMVHGDLDQADSPYAPLATTELRRFPVAGWHLGHQHRPLLRDDGAPWLLYPGSLQALDPGETGVHGAWEVTVAGGTLTLPRPVPLSSVRYENLVVDVSGCGDETVLRDAVQARLADARRAAAAAGGDALRLLRVRLAVTGSTPAAAAVAAIARGLAEVPLAGADDDLLLVVERVVDRVLPPLDLAALASGSTPAAEVARLLLALDGGRLDAEQQELLRRAAAAVHAVLGNAVYDLPGEFSPDEEAVRSLLRQAAEKLLRRMQEAQA